MCRRIEARQCCNEHGYPCSEAESCSNHSEPCIATMNDFEWFAHWMEAGEVVIETPYGATFIHDYRGPYYAA